MPTYRLYHFEEGHIVKARVLTADSNAEAIKEARGLSADQTSELWFGADKIKVFNPVS
jgi:hypothetical protein